MQPLFPLAFFNFLSVAAMMAFTVIVGPLIRQLELEEWHGGLMVAAAGISWMFLSRPWGHASDRKGRKPILMIAVGGFALVYLLLALFLEYAIQGVFSALVVVIALTLLRAVIGAFYAGIPVIGNALIADTIPQRDKRTSAMAMIGLSNALGMIIGPLLAGLLVVQSLILPIYFATLLPVIALLVLWLKLPNQPIDHAADLPKPKWHDQRLRLPMITAFIAMSSVIAAQILVGFFAIDRLHLSLIEAAKVAGYAMTAVGVTLVVVQSVMMKFPKFSARQLVMLGALITSIGFFSVTLAHHSWVLMLSYSIAAAGLGMVFTGMQSMTANAVESHEQGAAAGTVSAAYGLAMIIAPLLATLLYQFNVTIAYGIFALLLLCLSVVAYRHKPTQFTLQKQEG